MNYTFGRCRLHRWYEDRSQSKSRRLFVFVDDNGHEVEELSFSKLDIWAFDLAKKFHDSFDIRREDRVLLVFPPETPLFLPTLLACIYLGCVVVPVSPPRFHSFSSVASVGPFTLLWKIAKDCKAKVALTTNEIMAFIQLETSWNHSFSTDIRFYVISTVEITEYKDHSCSTSTLKELFSPNEDTLLMLQYSSGSTGDPKGVMLTHGNIFHNCLSIMDFCELSDKSVAVSWLPFFHDMGILGHLFTPLLSGPGLQILLSPLSFLKRPSLWFQLISKYRATVSGGPNFAYALMSKQITEIEQDCKRNNIDLDLSCWKVAFCGAEPIRVETIQTFVRLFSKYNFDSRNFRPVYGLAEASLLVSWPIQLPSILSIRSTKDDRVSVVSTDNLQRSLSGSSSVLTEIESKHFNPLHLTQEIFEDVSVRRISLGKCHSPTKLILVNPVDLTTCPPAQIGEIWVSGPSIAKGYWGKERLTEECFHAYTRDSKEGPFLRTGDLGFLLDEELFFTSRLKDLIVLNGVKYSPQDIEQVAEQSHPFFRQGCCVAFSDVEDKDHEEEQLIIAQEVKRGIEILPKMINSMKHNIQSAVFRAYGLSLLSKHIHLLDAGSLPKTTSGKLRRSECKHLLLNGTLRPISNGNSTSKRRHSLFFFNQWRSGILWVRFFFFYCFLLIRESGIRGASKMRRLLRSSFRWFSSIFRKSSIKTNATEHKETPNVSTVVYNRKSKDVLPRESKEMEDFLIRLLSKKLRIADGIVLNVDTCLSEYGMKSLDAVMIAGDLEQLTGRKISPVCFYQHDTIAKLARFLSASEGFLLLEDLSSASFTLPFQKENSLLSTENFNSVQSPACVLGIGTALPKYELDQKAILSVFQKTSLNLAASSTSIDKLEKLLRGSAIEKRYLSLSPLELSQLNTIEERNMAYNRLAPTLAAKAACKAIESWGGDKQLITHVLSVSCTGTAVPGLEFLLIDLLGLNHNVIRLGINFMGCFGGLAGLRTAQSIALSNASYRILLVCTELCSLQVQKEDLSPDNLVAESIFGDGAAAVIIGSGVGVAIQSFCNERALFQIEKANCYALPNSTEKIRWELSNTGWKVGLEVDIGYLLAQYLLGFCESLIGSSWKDLLPTMEFALHPGGKSILNLIESKLSLSRMQTERSWNVYRLYGNMSSATIFFILHDIYYDQSNEYVQQANRKILALAFGPGLSIEGILLKRAPTETAT